MVRPGSPHFFLSYLGEKGVADAGLSQAGSYRLRLEK